MSMCWLRAWEKAFFFGPFSDSVYVCYNYMHCFPSHWPRLYIFERNSSKCQTINAPKLLTVCLIVQANPRGKQQLRLLSYALT